jgi:hypothetical protein
MTDIQIAFPVTRMIDRMIIPRRNVRYATTQIAGRMLRMGYDWKGGVFNPIKPSSIRLG